MKSIQKLPVQERPREKLFNLSAEHLSDHELMVILLGKGTRGAPVHQLAERILALMDSKNGWPSMMDLLKIPGIGPAKAALLNAAMEFARRRIHPRGIPIRKPAHLLPHIRHYADRKQEHFLCTSLNGAGEIIATRVVTIGLVDSAPVHPREVFAEPIIAGSVEAHSWL